MRFTVSLTIAAMLVAATNLAVWITQSGGSPGQVELPEPDLRSLPMQLGQWSGEESEPSPTLVEKGDAAYAFARRYRNNAGKSVSLHISVITDYGKENLHHFPKYCYHGAGYKRQKMLRRPLKLGDDQEMPVDYSLWSRNEETVALAYWYHFGGEVYFNINEFRAAWRRRWGSRKWPPIVKVMLQTSSDQPNPPHLEEFAGLVAGWTRPLSVAQDKLSNPATRPR